jgi:hypothetical protein
MRSLSPSPSTTVQSSILGHSFSASRANVGEFACGQVAVHAGEIEPAPFAGAAGFQVAVVVLHEDRIVIEPPQAAVAKQMRQPVGAGVQLAIGHRLAG